METNDNVKKKGLSKVVILLSLLIIVALIGGFAYARYVTSLNGGTQAPIAKWNFKVTAGSTQSLSIDLAQTRYSNDTTEVDRTKVAPGTKGALVLNVDATGSQVSLKYDLDLSLTQIPENLIFYYDEQMTNAMYKQNGKIHLDGYFQANDTNKTAAKTLYWQWKLETGSTQDEIDDNDLLDSEWMGDKITLGIEATGRQVMDDSITQYEVVLNGEGGFFENYGYSNQITKNINHGEQYGELPIPKRNGYRFVGWSTSRDLFDENSIFSEIPDASYKNGYWFFSTNGAYYKYGEHKENGIQQLGDFKENTVYKLTIKGFNIVTSEYWIGQGQTDGKCRFQFTHTDGTKSFKLIPVDQEREIVYYSASNKTVKRIDFTFGIDATIYISDIQLEEVKEQEEISNITIATDSRVLYAKWEKE